jgi:deoxyribose-phosphate aldolase
VQLSHYIDHTLLKAEATLPQINTLCKEAVEHGFFSVCVNTSYVKTCFDLLKNTSVKVCCVVGFPLGAMETESKAFETANAVKNGATEIDMVIHIGALKDRRHEYVVSDIAAVVAAAKGHTVKVIIETSLLTDEEKRLACEWAMEAKAHFVKTSTGFAPGGAMVEDIRIMKKVVGDHLQIKASGGIKSLSLAESLIQAGASRLGTSSGVALIRGGSVNGGY